MIKSKQPYIIIDNEFILENFELVASYMECDLLSKIISETDTEIVAAHARIAFDDNGPVFDKNNKLVINYSEPETLKSMQDCIDFIKKDNPDSLCELKYK
jgi:hypothetical protein